MSDELLRERAPWLFSAEAERLVRQQAAEDAAEIWRKCQQTQTPQCFAYRRWRKVLPTGQIYENMGSIEPDTWRIVDKRADTPTEIARLLLHMGVPGEPS